MSKTKIPIICFHEKVSVTSIIYSIKEKGRLFSLIAIREI